MKKMEKIILELLKIRVRIAITSTATHIRTQTKKRYRIVQIYLGFKRERCYNGRHQVRMVNNRPCYTIHKRYHKCNFCLTEKFHIIKTSLELINKRSELISKCRHENKFYLMNFKEVPSGFYNCFFLVIVFINCLPSDNIIV